MKINKLKSKFDEKTFLDLVSIILLIIHTR